MAQELMPWEDPITPPTTGYRAPGLPGTEPKIALPPTRAAAPPPAKRELMPWEDPASPAQPQPQVQQRIQTDKPPVQKTIQAFWEGIGGQALMDIMGGASRDPARAERARQTLQGVLQGITSEPGRVWGELSRTGEAMTRGDLSGTAYHLAGAVPLFGAPAQQIGIELATGKPAEAVGHLGALVAPFVAGPVTSAAGRGAATAGTVTRGAVSGAIRAVPAAAEAAVEKSVYGALGGPGGMAAAAKIAAVQELGKAAIAGGKAALAERAAARAGAEAATYPTGAYAPVSPDYFTVPPARTPLFPVPDIQPPPAPGPGPLFPVPNMPPRPPAPTIQLALPPGPRILITPPPAVAPETRVPFTAIPGQYPEVIPPALRGNAPAETTATTLRDLMQQSGTAPPPETAPPAAPETPIDFAAVARGAKTEKLAQLLRQFEIPATDAQQMDAGQWAQLAKAAGVSEPSEITRAQTLKRLGDLERAAAPAAAAGLPPETATMPPAQAEAAFQEAKAKAQGTIGGDAGQAQAGSRSRSRASETVSQPSGPSPGLLSDSRTVVRVPGEETSYAATYGIRELDDVQPSHNATTFQRNPNYRYQNDRDYSNPANQERIVINSQPGRFDPAYLLTDSPDATNGAPVIDRSGNVLGGNNRTMIIDRVYRNNPEGAAAYRAELVTRAAQLGIDPAQVAAMKRPVLVREISQADIKPQRIITDLNKTGTAALTAAERATADARTMSPVAADSLAAAIEAEGTDATLNDVLSGKRGVELVNKLVDDGVFTMQEKPNLIDSRTGSVTAAAKERISKMLLGQVFESADQLTRTPLELRSKLERVVAPILQSGQKTGFDLLPTLRQSIDLIEYARVHGMTNLRDAIAQESMFGDAPQFSPAAVDLAEFIRDSKPTEVSKAFRRYVANAKPSMFGESTPAEAFADAFGTTPPVAEMPASAGKLSPAEAEKVFQKTRRRRRAAPER